MKTVLIHSYKGGSGKSLVALNLGMLLAHNGSRVLVIEADFDMPVFKEDIVLGRKDPKYFFNHYLQQDHPSLDNYIYNILPNLDVIYCVPNYELEPQNIGDAEDMNSWYLRKLRQIDNGLDALAYDYVIFDMQPGLNYASVNFSIISDHIILLTRPDDYSINSTIGMYQNFYSKYNIFENKILYLIINQIPQIDIEELNGEFEPLGDILRRWKIQLQSNIKQLNHIFEINLDMYTILHLASKGMIQPADKGINQQLINMLEFL